MFSICAVTALLLLLTSLWFSMHAEIVANSLKTKMLVSTVRIPMPTDIEMETVVPEVWREGCGRFGRRRHRPHHLEMKEC